MRQNQSVLTDILSSEERAMESVVARYLRVAPAVTRFARTLSGNEDLKIRLGPEPSASRDEIVLDPSMFQAAYARHAPVTPEEVALASALHEVVHLLATDLSERRPIPTSWTSQAGPEPVGVIEALDTVGHPAAAALFFAIEDARQEEATMNVYPGARSVLADLYEASRVPALTEGSPLAQFALSCFLVAGGYESPPSSLDPRVAAAMDDAQPILERVGDSTGPWDVAERAVELLDIARHHGLLRPPGADPATDQRRKEADAQTITDGIDQVRLLSSVVHDAQGHDQVRRAAESRTGASGRKAPAELAGEASTDQLLRVGQAPTVFLPTGQRGKVIVTPFPSRFRDFGAQGRAALQRATKAWGVAQHHVSGELHPLFIANQRRGLRAGFDTGDLSPYSALFLGAGLYQRMYERRDLPSRRAYAVSLLVDGSASMLTHSGHWAMAGAALGAWTLAHLCDELQIEFEVAVFNRTFAARVDDTEQSYIQRRRRTSGGLRQRRGGEAVRLTNTVNHYLIKSFDDPWRRSQDLLAGLFWTAAEPVRAAEVARRNPVTAPPVSLFEKAANVDEFNLSHAARRMASRRSNVRVLVVLSDGMTRGSLEALAVTASEIERSGTTVLGIGIGDATVDQTYSRYQLAGRPEELTRAMIDGVRDALRRSLALWGVDTWWARAASRPKETSSV